jgi:hypothetical protein
MLFGIELSRQFSIWQPFRFSIADVDALVSQETKAFYKPCDAASSSGLTSSFCKKLLKAPIANLFGYA